MPKTKQPSQCFCQKVIKFCQNGEIWANLVTPIDLKPKTWAKIKERFLQQCEWKLIFSRKLKNLNGNAGWPPHGFEFMNFWHKIIYLTLFNFWNESSECSWARLVQDDSDPKYLISYEFFFSLNGKCFQWTTILIVCLNRKRENFKNIFIEGAKRIIAVMTL